MVVDEDLICSFKVIKSCEHILKKKFFVFEYDSDLSIEDLKIH